MNTSKIIANLSHRSNLNRFTQRYIRIERLSNKKVTRIESDVELEDCEFRARLVNRNPRNLEQSRIENKPGGFWFDKCPPTHWNRITLEQSSNHTSAHLEHWSGKRLISASTNEPQLVKYFRNPDTRQAAVLLGRVISRRCQQAGYLFVDVDSSLDSDAPRIKAFLDSVVSEGLVLSEPPAIEPHSNTDI